MTINVYWTRCNPGETELRLSGLDGNSMISPLRVEAPVPLLKHMDYKEFFGPAVSRCPAIVDDLKNIFVIKSPVDLKLEVQEDHTMKVVTQSVQFAQSFLGNAQGKMGLHQMALGYLFIAEKSLIATQLPAYYDLNSFTENAFLISASFDIGSWFRVAGKPAFAWKPGARTVDIKEGDALMYFKFNTSEKVRLIEFDDTEHNKQGDWRFDNTCARLKHQGTGIIPLAKCYEYFHQFKLRQRILKMSKKNIVKD